MTALCYCAEKKQVGEDAVISKVAASKGPVLKGTRAEKVALHDDKSLYTGVYAKGGPTNVDTDKYRHLDQLLDRSDADVRGRKLEGIGHDPVHQVAHQVAGVHLQVEEEKKSAPRKASNS